MGISGCLVFLLVVTSRRDELANLRDDLQDRLTRGRQERQAAKLAWEAIQRIELATTETGAYEIVDETARSMGCELVQISCGMPRDRARGRKSIRSQAPGQRGYVSGPSAVFRLSGGQGLMDHGSWAAGGLAARGRHRLSLPSALVPGAASSGWNGCEPVPHKGGAHGRNPSLQRRCTPTQHEPAVGKCVAGLGQSGGRKNDLKLLEGTAPRFWMVLAVAVPLAITVVDHGAGLPPVYVVKAEIEINPPQLDPWLSTLLSHEIGRRDPSSPDQLHRQPRGRDCAAPRWPSGL